MDLKQLKTFIYVAETGSLGRAADRMHLAQPALSRHIRLLEAEIGVELFVRHGRGMALTDAGAELLRRVGGLVAQIENSIADVRVSAEPSGHVTLGLYPTIVAMLGTRILSRAARELPAVTIRFVEAFPPYLVSGLQRGDIDVALLIGPDATLHLRTVSLLSEELVLIGARESDLHPKNPVKLAHLGRYPLILPGPTQRHGSVVVAAAARHGIELNIPFEVDSLTMTLDMVTQGLGYTLAPLSALNKERDFERLRYTTLTGARIQREVLLAREAGRPDTRAITALVSLIIDEVASLVEAGTWAAVPDAALKHRPVLTR